MLPSIAVEKIRLWLYYKAKKGAYKVKNIWNHREFRTVGDLRADPGHRLHFASEGTGLERVNDSPHRAEQDHEVSNARSVHFSYV